MPLNPAMLAAIGQTANNAVSSVMLELRIIDILIKQVESITKSLQVISTSDRERVKLRE